MLGILKNYLNDESGATTIEYALTAALIGMAAIKSIHCIGEYCLKPMFSGLAAGVEGTSVPTDSSDSANPH